MKSDDIERSNHVMPTLACAMAGIYGCGLLYLSLFQHYIRQQTTTALFL